MRNQRLIFYQVAVFGHVKRMIGLNCDFMAHINEKIEKTDLPTILTRVTVVPRSYHFEDSVSPMEGGLTKYNHGIVERGHHPSFIIGVAKRGISTKWQKSVEESTEKTFTKCALRWLAPLSLSGMGMQLLSVLRKYLFCYIDVRMESSWCWEIN